MLGLYIEPQAPGWRGITQRIGSGLLMSSTALLIAAFTMEPEKGFQPEMWWSHMGLYAMFAGCMLHVASSIGKPRSGN